MPSSKALRSTGRRHQSWKSLLSAHHFRQLASATIRDLPRWIFLAALIYAPWAYGGTTASSITGINWLLGSVITLWFIEMASRRRRPLLPISLVIVSAVVVILGWLAAVNPRAVFDTEIEVFAPLQNRLSFAPSSVDGAMSVALMAQASLLVGSVLFVVDLSQRPQWLLRMWITVGVAGSSIALLGLLQRSTGAVLPFWEYQPNESSSFFATYYYHANAGAFLNLVLPLTVGLTLRAFEKPGLRRQKAIWLTATVILLGAVLTNTSRAAQFVGVTALAVLAIGPLRRMWRGAATANRRIVVAAAVLAIAGLFAIVQTSGMAEADTRWRPATDEISNNIRWQAYKVALGALPDANWSGFGPGTFRVVFPYYWRFPTELTGRWHFLHDDYLQTILEWGWAGAACWALIFFGGFGAAFVGLKRMRRHKTLSRLSRMLPVVLIALGTVAVHSLVDFPLQIASLQLYAATYLGICWSSRAASRPLARE
jgi:O-antigen ligase